MRARLIKIVTFIAGLYFLLEFVLPKFVLESIGVDAAHENISNGVVLVGVMAAGLGIINLFMVHGAKIAFRRKGYPNSAALLLGLVFMMCVAIADWGAGLAVEKSGARLDMLSQFAERIIKDREAGESIEVFSKRVALLQSHAGEALEELHADVTTEIAKVAEPDIGLATSISEYKDSNQVTLAMVADDLETVEALLIFSKNLSQTQVAARPIFKYTYEQSNTKNLWNFLFNGLFVSLGSAMFSLLGVYIAAAAYRAFRVRTFESSLMMLAAVLVMLGQIPFGLWIYDGMPDIRQWLLEYPNGASFRAIKLGAAVAGLVISFRMWLSLESDYSVDEEAV